MTETNKLLTPLTAPVPPRTEGALGYDGDARYVAFYWQPAGDEVMYDDGQVSADGDWWAWIDFVNHPAVYHHLLWPCPQCHGVGTTNQLENETCTVCDGAGRLPLNLGNSDEEATHWLILDRQERKFYVAPIATARRFLQEQWPPPPELTPEEQASIFEAFQEAVAKLNREWQPPSDEELQAILEESMQACAEMKAWLDGQVEEGDTHSPSSLRREE